MIKRIIAILLCVLLALPTCALAAFPDVTDTVLSEKIALLETLGIVKGNTDGTYGPQNRLSRAEFVTLVVRVLGRERDALSFGGFTIFPDVASSHWAAPYINFASRELKLVQGDLSTGAFRPEDSISYAEAVTVILRALDYTDADVGFNWPDGYINLARSVGVSDGVNLAASNIVNRADGAVLFYNALMAENKSGKTLISNYVGSVIQDTLILATDAVASDGTVGCLRIDNAANPVLKTNDGKALDSSLVGKRANVTLDKNGAVLTVELKAGTSNTITVSYADSDKVTAQDGTTHKIAETVRIFTEEDGFTGETTTYSKVRTSLNGGDALTFMYRADGSLDYVLLHNSTAGEIAIVGVNTTAQTLHNTLRANGETPIYKNGTQITNAQLQTYDVATYNAAAGVIIVSDFKLGGKYEAAFPNASAPRRVTTLGNEFELDERAAASLLGMKVGDSFVLLFTADGRVARALPAGTVTARPAGLYDGENVSFIGGPTIKLKLTGFEAGELVTISANGAASRISGRSVTAALNLETGRLGDSVLAAGCAFFERVSDSAPAAAISRSDLTKTVYDASEIAAAVYDTAGNPYIIIFGDVTGDRYSYGEISTRSEQTGGVLSYTQYYAAVTGAFGKREYTHPSTTLPKDGWGGLAPDRSGAVAKAVELLEYKGLSRSDFSGSDSVFIDGIAVPIAAAVQVYQNSTKTYMTAASAEELVADARTAGSSFDVLLDKTPGDGGKVRIIIVY